MNREDALTLIQAQNPEAHMLQHALASEAVMRALARRFGKDEALWGLAGLVHDVDYPFTKDTPEKHGLTAAELLRDKAPEAVIQAVMAHNSEYNGTAVSGKMDIALRAAESVTGLVSAAALVRPTGYEGMAASSLKKKMKDKAFAASVSRERIKECEQAGLSLDEFLTISIEAMAAM